MAMFHTLDVDLGVSGSVHDICDYGMGIWESW